MKTYAEADEIRLVHSGNNYFDVLCGLIDGAKEVVHFQTYIFDSDSTGEMVMDCLARAAQRGVKVYFMADAYGSFQFAKSRTRELREKGVNFRFYSPLFSSESLFIGRRLHHKVAVADKQTGLIAGINVSDKYHFGPNDTHPWLDYGVFVKGAVCEYLHLLCEKFYFKKNSRELRLWEHFMPRITVRNDGFIRFRRNDWIRRRNEIHQSYTEAIAGARKSITIVASYFLPSRHIRNLLQEASERGVAISILLAGQSDIITLRLAENYLYDFYLRNNIRLYEWTNSVMHGKAMIVDEDWATVGSYNMNFLSHYISIELNADILDKPFINGFAEHLRDITTNQCTLIDTQRQQRRGMFYRLLMWMAYSFFRILKMSTHMSKRYRTRRLK